MSVFVSCRYAMLVCSLPALPSQPFGARQTPLSRLQLEQRLAMLEPEHLQELILIENALSWERMAMDSKETELLQRWRDALLTLRSSTLKNLIGWRLELRALMAAMRIRKRVGNSRVDARRFEHSAYCDYIQRNWDRPDFGLSHIHPFLREAHRLLTRGDCIALERLLFDTVWNHLSEAARDHHFDFEAVVLYVLRWNLVDRWIRHDQAAAKRRFLQLMKEGLGDNVMPFIDRP